MTEKLTDALYAETLDRIEDGHADGSIHVERWCDGSGPCAVETEPHGHWRGGVNVSAREVILRCLKHREEALEAFEATAAHISKERDAAIAEVERLTAALAAAQANTDYTWCEKHDWEDLQPCPDCDTGSE